MMNVAQEQLTSKIGRVQVSHFGEKMRW